MLISPYASSSQRLYDKISQATSTPASALGAPTVASRDSATVTLLGRATSPPCTAFLVEKLPEAIRVGQIYGTPL